MNFNLISQILERYLKFWSHEVKIVFRSVINIFRQVYTAHTKELKEGIFLSKVSKILKPVYFHRFLNKILSLWLSFRSLNRIYLSICSSHLKGSFYTALKNDFLKAKPVLTTPYSILSPNLTGVFFKIFKSIFILLKSMCSVTSDSLWPHRL